MLGLAVQCPSAWFAQSVLPLHLLGWTWLDLTVLGCSSLLPLPPSGRYCAGSQSVSQSVNPLSQSYGSTVVLTVSELSSIA
jgi:hypothetical protein